MHILYLYCGFKNTIQIGIQQLFKIVDKAIVYGKRVAIDFFSFFKDNLHNRIQNNQTILFVIFGYIQDKPKQISSALFICILL